MTAVCAKMATVVEALWRQALTTFSSKMHKTKILHNESFDKLKALADHITASDVKLDSSLLTTTYDTNTPNTARQPPVTYIEIYEDKNITIGIFILKPGARIPLHDHPNMYGILKVLSGCAKIQCYSLLPNQPPSPDVNSTGLLYAEKLPQVVVCESDRACVLTPTERNLHEIESVGGAVAFLDILAPPYESHYCRGENECHYFQETGRQNVDGEIIASLLNIQSPPDFWSKSAPYLGPPLRENSD